VNENRRTYLKVSGYQRIREKIEKEEEAQDLNSVPFIEKQA